MPTNPTINFSDGLLNVYIISNEEVESIHKVPVNWNYATIMVYHLKWTVTKGNSNTIEAIKTTRYSLGFEITEE